MEASHLRGLSPPEALVILHRELLGGANTNLIRKSSPAKRRPKELAVQIIAETPNIGVRKLAKMVGVSASTITRWHQEDEFRRQVDYLRWRVLKDFPNLTVTSLLDRCMNLKVIPPIYLDARLQRLAYRQAPLLAENLPEHWWLVSKKQKGFGSTR